MPSVLNISAYKFVTLPDAQDLRDTLHERALALGLKGTVLLAEEGINLFLAGPAAAADWKEYTYPDFSFTVHFPADPKIEITAYEASDGRSFEARIYSVGPRQPTP